MKKVTFTAYGKEHAAIVIATTYQHSNQTVLLVYDLKDDGTYDESDMWGVLTVCLPEFTIKDADRTIFLKNWSENSQWAEDVAKQLGGKPTGYSIPSGFVEVPIWQFDKSLFEICK